MRILLCIVVLTIGSRAVAQKAVFDTLVPPNVVSRILWLSFAGGDGTGFILDYKNRQYVVTANHLMEAAGGQATVSIFENDRWQGYDATVLHGPNQCIDVAVLVFPNHHFITAGPVSTMSDDQFFFGEEAYFLGFPYGLSTSFKDRQWAAPVYKHGYISAKVLCSKFPELKGAAPDERLILMDAMNNRGFSGGPVVAPDLNLGDHPQKIVGIVKAYKEAEFKEGEVAGNSGISLVVPINRALELIEQYAEKQSKPK